MYRLTFEVVVSIVAVREENKKYIPIYFVGHGLSNSELNHPIIKKLALALITIARELRSYFKAHLVNVLTYQPLKKEKQTYYFLWRMLLRALELLKFDTKYRPKIAIKAQAMSDFLAKCMLKDKGLELGKKKWCTTDVDGSSTQNGLKVKLIISPREKVQVCLEVSIPKH